MASSAQHTAPQTPNPRSLPRVPPAVHGVQVNHCKNPSCPNFRVPVTPTPTDEGFTTTTRPTGPSRSTRFRRSSGRATTTSGRAWASIPRRGSRPLGSVWRRPPLIWTTSSTSADRDSTPRRSIQAGKKRAANQNPSRAM